MKWFLGLFTTSWTAYAVAAGAVLLATSWGAVGWDHAVTIPGLERDVATAREETKNEKAGRLADRTLAAEAARKQEALFRTTEQTWQTKQQETEREAQTRIAAAQADAAAATAASGRLRTALATARTTSGRAASNPAVVLDCQAAGQTGVVLADVLSRVVERTGQLAAEADATRIAGESCQRSYEALTEKSP